MFESALRIASERAAIVRAALQWVSGTEAINNPVVPAGHEARGMTEADALGHSVGLGRRGQLEERQHGREKTSSRLTVGSVQRASR